MIWWKKTQQSESPWHYFPIQLASRPQMGRRVEIDMGFPGVFKTQGSLGKGPRFFWLRRKFAQHVGFYGTSTDNFCLKLPSKLVSKVFFSFNHQLFYTFQVHKIIPKMSLPKIFTKSILENRLGRNRFALFIGSIHWTSMVNQQLKSFLLEAWRFHGLQLGMQQSTWFNGSVLNQVWNNEKNNAPPWGCD